MIPRFGANPRRSRPRPLTGPAPPCTLPGSPGARPRRHWPGRGAGRGVGGVRRPVREESRVTGLPRAAPTPGRALQAGLARGPRVGRTRAICHLVPPVLGPASASPVCSTPMGSEASKARGARRQVAGPVRLREGEPAGGSPL